jgi:hypothetical protein
LPVFVVRQEAEHEIRFELTLVGPRSATLSLRTRNRYNASPRRMRIIAGHAEGSAAYPSRAAGAACRRVRATRTRARKGESGGACEALGGSAASAGAGFAVSPMLRQGGR